MSTYNPIIIPEDRDPDKQENTLKDLDERLGSLGVLSEEEAGPTLKEVEPQEEISDAEMLRRMVLQNFISKISHCLPHFNHPTKKRLTRSKLIAKRKREKMARRANRNNRLKKGMKWAKSHRRARRVTSRT